MTRPREQVLAAIDVGTNAVRLELARPLPDGSLETLHQERDPVRPGEGVFKTGGIPPEVADRLLSTLRRYSALCKRFHANVRAVATSALREASNRDEILQRVRTEAGLALEIVSGQEEARLICLGVLHGRPADERSLVVDIGGGSTEVANAVGEKPSQLWSVAIGAVRLTEIFDSSEKVGAKKLDLMRRYADEAFRESLPQPDGSLPRQALGSSGTIQTVVRYASAGTGHATTTQIARALDKLAELSPTERRRAFDPKRAEIIVGGAVILEAVARHLALESITSVDKGLRDGLLVDLLRRGQAMKDTTLADAALLLGRRFAFDEPHGRHVAALTLALFDQLAALHGLTAAARPLVEAAALLHDLGNAVSYTKHHKHTAYLIENADIPGINVRERSLIALIARFHRRSAPERAHELLAPLPPAEFRIVRRASMLLRLADSLDRSHQQPVKAVRAQVRDGKVTVRLVAKSPVDLELWDAAHEVALFKRTFARELELVVVRA